MRKRILLVVLVVSILIMSSYALAVKPASPPGLSKDKNVKAPGHWKKTMEFESQKHFVNFIHERILLKLEAKDVFPPGLIRLVSEFILSFGLMEIAESGEETKVEVSGEVDLDEDGQAILDELLLTFEGLEGKYELKLKIKKQEDVVTLERNEINEIVGELSPEQLDLWDSLLENVTSLVTNAEGDDVELEIEIEHELEIEEEEIEELEPIEE